MVRQYILSSPDRKEFLYVSADHTYFSFHSLTSLADEWANEGGKTLIIDEVHKYPEWSRELKQIYDTHPGLKIIFTGSSILDIHKGAADLSRRALIFMMQGLSFREYLMLEKNIEIPVYSLGEILNNQVEMPLDFHPLPLFREYLKKGYYPFSSQPGYEIRLQQVVNQTIEGDIPQYARMHVSTGRKLKQLLVILSQSAPYKPNITSLCTELRVSKNDIPDYLAYLETAGMITVSEWSIQPRLSPRHSI